MSHNLIYLKTTEINLEVITDDFSHRVVSASFYLLFNRSALKEKKILSREKKTRQRSASHLMYVHIKEREQQQQKRTVVEAQIADAI
jgi:hypothetical protein